jgi:PAS domain S-box-containing protein
MHRESASPSKPWPVGLSADEGGGACGALLRAIDWAATPLGPIDGWPTSLTTILSMLLHSRHPMFLWWGPELIQFYNDAYVPSFGRGKHPAAMGQAGRECWQEIWEIIGPQIDDVMRLAKPSWNEDQLVPIFRNGRIEEVYWTYGYSPVFAEHGAVAGTLVVCTETTSRVVAECRFRTIRTMDEHTSLTTDVDALWRCSARVFESAAVDIPFALIYTREPSLGSAQLIAAVGVAEGPALTTLVAQFSQYSGWDAREPATIPEPVSHLHDLATGSWPANAAEAFLVPFAKSATQPVSGFIVFGLNPALAFDVPYREHLTQLSARVALELARIDGLKLRAALIGERNNLLLKAPIATALLTGPEHVFELANPLYLQIVGRQNLNGQTFRQAFPELVLTALPGVLDHVYQTGEPFVTNELVVRLDRKHDGTLDDVFCRFNLEPLRDSAGTVYGVMAVLDDITDQVSARRALEKAHDERAKLLAELEAASRAKDEFLAMLGHELRNPLSPIVTALQLMRLHGDRTMSKAQEVIERQVDHLVRLVDDLLDISRITRGKVELRKEHVELAEVCNKAVEMASVLLKQRKHTLAIDVPVRGLRWEGDPVRLAQVVANLLTNAARYTEVGGHIVLAAHRDADEVVIRVVDDGIGIDAEMLPRIFDLFVQGKRSSDRAEGGLGLGLALVKNLVAMHGGSVVAQSEGVGRGSEFVIRLPAAPSGELARETSAPARSAQPAPAVTPKRVLVVDDNVDAADLLSDILRNAGHDVRVANDPLTALSTADEFRPDVAVLDIGLPVMDGYELATRMRASPAGVNCRLIALTGYGQDHDHARSSDAGFSIHLVKPVDLDRLKQLLNDG